MTYQPELDFTHTRENNSVSQKILDVNRVRLSSQVIKVLDLLAWGYENEIGVKVWHLDFATAYTMFNIGDLRRRICDVKEKFDIEVSVVYGKTGKATYSLDECNKIRAMEISNKLRIAWDKGLKNITI